MPKINEVINEYKVPPLKQRILHYLLTHSDEVFSYDDFAQLRSLVNHNGWARDLIYSLWELHQQGQIESERLGSRIYFGSKDAIAELRQRKKK